MQELKPSDMSLPERVSVLERRLEKVENKRKVMMALFLDMMKAQRLYFTEKAAEALAELDA